MVLTPVLTVRNLPTQRSTIENVVLKEKVAVLQAKLKEEVQRRVAQDEVVRSLRGISPSSNYSDVEPDTGMKCKQNQ